MIKREDETYNYLLITEDMDLNFGVVEVKEENIFEMNQENILKRLTYIGNNQGEFPFFVIQLNDIKELSDYHISENVEINSILLENKDYWVENGNMSDSDYKRRGLLFV